MQPRERSELVTLLVEGRFPIEPIRSELARYPWDAEEPLVVFQRKHVVAVLRRYLHGELSAAQVASWADALELRDDVGFPDQDAVALQRLIFVLANPTVNGDLTFESARTLLASVEVKSPDIL
jgi:hypothetical protein